MSKNIYNPLNLDNPVHIDYDDLSDHEPFSVNQGSEAGELNSFYGHKHSKQSKKLIGEKSRNRSPEVIEKIRQGVKLNGHKIAGWNKGISTSEETKKKLSEASRNAFTDERKKAYSSRMSGKGNHRYGIKMTEETKMKISKAKLLKVKK